MVKFMAQNLMITSTARVYSKGQDIEVGIDLDTVNSIANSASTYLLLANGSVKDVMQKNEIKECFAYALEVVLYQNSGAKPSHERIPAFLTDIVKSLNCKYRGVAIRVKALDEPKRPNSYDDFLNVMASMGIPCERVSRVDPERFTEVLLIKVRQDSEGVDTLVGANPTVSIDDLVLRAMITVAKEQQDILDRIIGYTDQMYGSKDELVRQWAVSFPVAKS